LDESTHRQCVAPYSSWRTLCVAIRSLSPAHQENPDAIPICKGSDVDSSNQDCSAPGADAILYPVFN
jgi:hypothetical protein